MYNLKTCSRHAAGNEVKRMYEQFGSLVDQITKSVSSKLFVPDGERAPSQHEGGGLPRLKDVFVVGSFQNPATKAWSINSPVKMVRSDFGDPELKGFVYAHKTAALPDGFYEYKYLVHFENADPRLLTDPCARYGGGENQNSGFVVGGR